MSSVLLTGASSGIGLATSFRLISRGYQVLLLSNDEPELQQVCSDLGPLAVAVVCDLSQAPQLEGLWDRLESSYGPIEILINNAGIGYQAEIVDTPQEVVRNLLEINFLAAASLCQQALLRMRERRRGKILNLTSAAARRSLGRIGAYAASKAALHALTQSLYLEAAAYGVSVSEVLPISVSTPFFKRAGYRPQGLVQSADQVAEHILRCLDNQVAERTTHWPTALGFVLDALCPNWVARLLSKHYRSR